MSVRFTLDDVPANNQLVLLGTGTATAMYSCAATPP